MPMCAEVLAIGPFSNEVADLLDYPRAHYATTRPGTSVVTFLFGIVEGSNAGRDFAAALGITDPWDFNQHFIEHNRIDFRRLRIVLSGFAGSEDYLRDAARMETLARHGFVFYFLPNG